MKRMFILVFLFSAGMALTGNGQEISAGYKNPYGNLFIYSDPQEVTVQIPGAGIKTKKMQHILMIEYLSPGRYLVKTSCKKEVHESEVEIVPYRTLHLKFDLEHDSTIFIRQDTIVDDDSIYTAVESQPGFPGGEKARLKFLAKNLEYPLEARQKGIQGKVYVTFIVEKDGTLSNIRVLKGIGGGCDEEAVRVVHKMPKWIPGMEHGNSVRVRFNLPVRFTLTP